MEKAIGRGFINLTNDQLKEFKLNHIFKEYEEIEIHGLYRCDCCGEPTFTTNKGNVPAKFVTSNFNSIQK